MIPSTDYPEQHIPFRPTDRSHRGTNPLRDESGLLEVTSAQEHAAASGMIRAMIAAGYRFGELRGILITATRLQLPSN